MPEAGNYLFTRVSFSKTEKPVLSLQQGSETLSAYPLDETMTLTFDTSTRHCTGWYDMRTGEDYVCPDQATTSGTYEQCLACQKRTGFNPAFYHATSVSSQQEERNLEPHMLYLAHFGTGIVKVGISHAARGNSRLLEQGARSALILDTFPTAHIARQYEAKIAALPGVIETLQLRKKIMTLTQTYDTKTAVRELENIRAKIERTFGVSLANNNVKTFDRIFFPKYTPTLTEAYDCTLQNCISGHVIGVLGTLLFCEQQNVSLFLPLKKFVGYRMWLSYQETRVTLPAQQTSLF